MNIEIRRKKQTLGFLYGLTAGAAFAIFTWGVDAVLLARSNAAFYWIKFLPGLAFCTICASLAGWLTIRFERHGLAVIAWGILGLLYAWISVWLPLVGSINFIRDLAPNLATHFDISQVKDIYQIQLVSLVAIGLASMICGLLEINLIQQSALSTHSWSIISALLICISLFAISGSAVDQMINANLRQPIQVINQTLQFAADNQGVDVPKQTSRKMHLSAVNQLGDLIQKNRQLLLVGYDEDMIMMDTLVDFEGTLVKCTIIYAQPTDCIILH
jgi:hypothetical protein